MNETKKPIRNFLRKILNKLNLAGIIQLYINSAVKDYGWFKSYKTKESVDKNGNPIPWNTYPFLAFIEPRLKSNFKLFEFGSGNSTIWYAQKVNSITAVEHNEEWYKKVKRIIPKNAEVILHNEFDEKLYCNEIEKHDKLFEIVIIDGIFRNECAVVSLNYLTEDGIIVFDDTEREDYNSSFKLLAENGFKRIDFRGMRGITSIINSTSIFYRRMNCLNI